MLTSRKLKTLTAALLVVGMAACTTTKAPDNTAAAQQAAADKAAADKAAADAAAARAAQTAAASTDTGMDSQSLADAKAKAEAADKANQLAASLGARIFYFDFDSSSLHDADQDTLKAHAFYLSKNPSAHVQVNGHADERGTREYNMALGERRAKAVAAFLTSNGAKASQLEVVSYGKEKPAVDGHDEAAWAKNRRVELEYTAGKP